MHFGRKKELYDRKAKAEMLAKEQQRQFLELKKKEEEAKFLKFEERKLQESEELIYKTTMQRNLSLEQRRKQKYGSFLISQNKQNLLRKNKQIQEDLQNDLELLKEIKKKEEEEYKLKTDLKNEQKKDALYMQSILERQLQLEKIREIELNKLYQQESFLQWQKRNTEWEAEKVAREKLLSSVLEERKNQIKIKRETLKLIKEETIREREFLLQELEKHQLSTQREKFKQDLKKKKFEHDLREQVLTERVQKKLEKQTEEQEIYLKSMQKSLDDERLAKEINQLTGEPCFRRRRIPFT